MERLVEQCWKYRDLECREELVLVLALAFGQRLVRCCRGRATAPLRILGPD